MTIGEALRRFRSMFKLTQDDVAGVLKVTRQAYQSYERDKSNPPSQKILDLANTYNVSADYLLGLSDMPRPNFYDKEELKDAFAAREELRQLRSILFPSMNSKHVEMTGAIAQ